MEVKRLFRELAGLLALLCFFGCATADKTEQRGDDQSVDVVIVGAGLAGLSTAYRLQKAGLTYRIVELSPHVGGRIRTASYLDGSSAELGLEEFWEGNPTLEIIKDLKLPTEPSAASFSSFYYKGKIHPFTQDTNADFRKSVFQGKELEGFLAWDAKAIALYKQTRLRPLPDAMKSLMKISFADWVRSHKGLTEKAQEFIRIESEPEFATSWESISALDGLMEWHIFSGAGSNSWHVQGGNQKLPEAMAARVGTENIVLNTKVTRIASQDEGVIVEGVDQGNFEQRRFRGRFVVTTMPLFRLMELQFFPPLGEDRKNAIQSQLWGSYFTAHVTLAPDSAKLVAHDVLPILTDGPLGCIYGPSEQKEGAPVLLNLLVTGPHAERFNLRAVMAMDSVRQELSEEFEKLWPGIKKYIQKFELHQYHPRAIASWPVGRSRLDEASDLMRKPQGRIYFAGDYTEGTHSDGAAQSAIRVTEDILSAMGKKKIY